MLGLNTAKLAKRVGKLLRDRGAVSDEQKAEYGRCSPGRGAAGFLYFLEQFVRIQDKASRRDVPFIPFEGQRRIIPDLAAGTWLCLLKGRQLGITWLIAAWALYCIIFNRFYVVTVVFQKKKYAQQFIWRVLYMYRRLPEWLRKRITTKNKSDLKFQHADNDGQILAEVGDETSGRSITGDLVVIDEASRVPNLDDTLQGMIPQIDVAGGQIVMLSSSAGPQGVFHETWQQTYGEFGELLDDRGVGPSGFKPVFLHWSERPGRGKEWQEREWARLDKISPVARKQEHPENPQEAFEYAAGRIYPLFRREHNIGDIEIPTTAELYRAIDWGESQSAHVVLWLAHVRGPSSFLVSPSCPNTIREFFSYRWDDDDPTRVLKEHDHTCDAVRYAVVTFRLTGLVYVYREWYVEDSVAKGWNPMKEIVKVHEMSGWRRNADKPDRWRVSRTGELYAGTVADRTWKKMIGLYNLHDLNVRPHADIRLRRGKRDEQDRPETEVKEGIRLVSALIDGTIDLDHRIQVTREEVAAAVEAAHRRVEQAMGQRVGVGLDRAALMHAARRYRAARGSRT